MSTREDELRNDFLKALRRDLPGALQEADERAVILPSGRAHVATALQLAHQYRQRLRLYL